MTSYKEQAIAGLAAVLKDGGLDEKGVDERFVEALLAIALDEEPLLAKKLSLPKSTFRLGKRGYEPDVVGVVSVDGEERYTCGIEVKLHSNINWGLYGGGVDQSQLERYAQTLGAVPLKLFTTDSRWSKIQAKLAATPWQPLLISTLTKSVNHVMKQRSYANSPATELLRGLARIL